MTQEELLLGKILQYKGYFASVNFSAEDKCFFGKIILQEPSIVINDVVSFEGRNVKELESAFENAVDSYLEACLELKKKPQHIL